ncbi:hypothetical protein [Curtobacterium sp. MCBD17_032]|uniref:hypothetical protein n=1 Tax=Curtobacterium sp. MCBD17_032 TaxID=2175659 RepID=UPI0011B75596|nr:hypothetical protein [Curtobacterium sp. MCBD17_032]
MQEQRRTIVITAVVTAAVFLGSFGVQQVFANESVYGTCNLITSSCRDVPLDTLELVAGYRWTASSTDVVESSANLRDAFNTVERVTGVIEFQGGSEGVSLGEGSSWPAHDEPARSPADGVATLKRLGATHIETMRNRDHLVVLRGTTGHSQLVYVDGIVDE